MRLSVYVAAPIQDKPLVRELHVRLAALDVATASSWAENDLSSNDFGAFTPTELRAYAQRNDADVRASDVVLVLAREGVGGEMFAEARFAIEIGKAVLWVGRRILSAFRPSVVMVQDIESAFALLADMKVHHASGYRGQLLATLCGDAS